MVRARVCKSGTLVRLSPTACTSETTCMVLTVARCVGLVAFLAAQIACYAHPYVIPKNTTHDAESTRRGRVARVCTNLLKFAAKKMGACDLACKIQLPQVAHRTGLDHLLKANRAWAAKMVRSLWFDHVVCSCLAVSGSPASTVLRCLGRCRFSAIRTSLKGYRRSRNLNVSAC